MSHASSAIVRRAALALVITGSLMGCTASRAHLTEESALPEETWVALSCLARYLEAHNLNGRAVHDAAEAASVAQRASTVYLERREPTPVLAIALDPAYGLFNILPALHADPLASAARIFEGTGRIALEGAEGCGLLASGSIRLQYSFVLRDESLGYPLDSFETVTCLVAVADARSYLRKTLSAEDLLLRSGALVAPPKAAS